VEIDWEIIFILQKKPQEIHQKTPQLSDISTRANAQAYIGIDIKTLNNEKRKLYLKRNPRVEYNGKRKGKNL